jgi:hypothetical protein
LCLPPPSARKTVSCSCWCRNQRIKGKWPDVGDGKEFDSSTAYIRKDARDTEETIRNTMLDGPADDISILFYRHEDKGNPPTD